MTLGYIEIVLMSGFGLFFQEEICPEWDKTLNSLLDTHSETAKLSSHTVQLGNADVWASNYPYSFGHLYKVYKGDRWEMAEERRPRIRTMVRFRELVLRLKAERDAHERRQYLKTLEDLTGAAK